jgi:multiphosphoryl transfer protein
MVADDLGPTEVAEAAPALAGVVLARGGATAHAAIVARSLGIPMVTGAGDGVLELADGARLVVDGSSGSVVLDPAPHSVRAAAANMTARRIAVRRALELRDQLAVTTDGTRITVLVNVASREELEVGLRAGAEGIGLLRTELAFLAAPAWPTEQEHARALAPILDRIGDRPAIVRVLDFGADKSPRSCGVRLSGGSSCCWHTPRRSAGSRARPCSPPTVTTCASCCRWSRRSANSNSPRR